MRGDQGLSVDGHNYAAKGFFNSLLPCEILWVPQPDSKYVDVQRRAAVSDVASRTTRSPMRRTTAGSASSAPAARGE